MKRLGLFILMLMLVFPMTLFAAGNSEKQDSGERETLNIGVITSLSGGGASIGVGQRFAAELAIEDINKAGGLKIGDKWYNVAGVIRDDETKPEVAIRRLREMTRDYDVTAFIGGTFGNISVALNNEAKNSDLFYIASNGVPESFYTKDVKAKTAAGIVAASEWAGRGAAAFMIDKLKVKKIACFLPDYSIGQGTLKGFEEIIKERSGVSYEVFWHPVGTADLTSYLIKVKEYAPDMVLVGSWGGDAITALKQINEMGINNQMKVMHFWLMNVFATGIPAEAIDGIYGQMFWYHDMTGFSDADVVKASQDFSNNYIKKYGDPPGPYAMTSYYAVMETARAMQLAGNTDPSDMMKALLANPEWEGAKGKATWREDGAVIYKYSTWIVEGKGESERTATTYDKKFDYAKIIDVYDGTAFVQPLSALGY